MATADSDRLNWLIERSAWVGWTREGEHCRVWLHGEDDEDSVPVCGWPVFFENPRKAIDAAMMVEME